MTESPFIKAEGPEPPDVADNLIERHLKVMSKVDDAILEQLKKQPIVHIPENTDTSNEYAYYLEQTQPDRVEIELARADVHRTQLELSRQRSKLLTATAEISRLKQVVRVREAMLFDGYQLIAQLIGYLDSIEWGTHDEWTRSQSLRKRAHEYVESFNTIDT